MANWSISNVLTTIGVIASLITLGAGLLAHERDAGNREQKVQDQLALICEHVKAIQLIIVTQHPDYKELFAMQCS